MADDSQLNYPPPSEPSPKARFRVIGRHGQQTRIPPTDYLLESAARFSPSLDAMRNWRFQWACYGLLPHNQITMLCAPANLGKSSVAFSILEQAITQRHMEAYYWHADSSPGDAATFGVRSHSVPNFFYLMPDFGGTPSMEAMRAHIHGLFRLLEEYELEPGALANQVHCFDAFSNFVEDANSKAEVKLFFADLKRLRGAGATVLLLHHPTKRKEDDQYIFDGVNNIRAELDNLMYLDPGETHGTWKDIDVRMDKKRASHAERFVESIQLNLADRTVAYGERGLEDGDHRLLDFLTGELLDVPYLTRPQAEELLRQKGASRDEARRLIELGITHARFGQELSEPGPRGGRPQLRLYSLDLF